MILTTTPSIEGKTISDYRGIVTGEAILGANLFRDFFAGVRDIRRRPFRILRERTTPSSRDRAEGTPRGGREGRRERRRRSRPRLRGGGPGWKYVDGDRQRYRGRRKLVQCFPDEDA